MTLGRDIAAALPNLRAQAESRMVDECIINGEPVRVWNPEKLDYDLTPTVVYTGKCRVRLAGTQATQGEQAGQLFVEQGATLSLPFSEPTSADVRKDHVVTITASESDPGLVGAKYTIEARLRQTHATARRFPIKETQ